MCDLDAPGVRDRPEDPLALVVAWWLVPADTTDVTVVSGRELSGSPFRGAPVDEHQLEPLVLPTRGEISKQELDGLRLRGRGGDDPAGQWQAGDVDRHDALRTVGVAVGSAAAMEDDTTVRGAAREMGVDHHHRGLRLHAAECKTRLRVELGEHERPRAVARPAAELGPDPCPRAELSRQEAPLTARVGDVQHAVDDAPQVSAESRAALSRCDEQRLEEIPLLVAQIARIRHASDHRRRWGHS